jgi:Glycosyltransferase
MLDRLICIGMVCPYLLDVPGGVQSHVLDLAETMIELGHKVSVLAPADQRAPQPRYVVAAGRALPLPYNGSIARLSFGPLAASRVARWLRNNQFDVVHVHEPFTPSLSMLAVMAARDIPLVATFHSAVSRSKAMLATAPLLHEVLERVTARIAVSPVARKVQVEHLGKDAWIIPNGVSVSRYANAALLPGWPLVGRSVGFLGRFTEPRKGFPTLLEAFEKLVVCHPDVYLVIAGPSNYGQAMAKASTELAERVKFLGLLSEADKARFLKSVDIYVAPNTGGESFGMILTEAMAAGTAIVASDLPSFRSILNEGEAGMLFPPGNATELAKVLSQLLSDDERRRELSVRAKNAVARYDWSVVAREILEVYSVAIAANRRDAG